MPAPANDDLANAQLLTGASGSITATPADSTIDTPYDPLVDSQLTSDSIWYKVAIPNSDAATAMTVSFTCAEAAQILIWGMAPGETFPPTDGTEWNQFETLGSFTGSLTFPVDPLPDDGYVYFGVGDYGTPDTFTFTWTFHVVEGIVWAPDDAALEVNPAWVRLDAEPYRLATSYQIVRGRSSETDKVTTGTATVAFRDTHGMLDPTNPSSPFWDSDNNITKLDPMTQAAIALKNPVTDEWHTLFRGFVAENGHDLDMFTQEQGFDVVTWSLVDAFDLFANVILTHGTHGNTPSLATFPNIYYQGTPSNLPGEPDVFVHVDQRIMKLLDDAGWPGTGETIDVDNLRNIFSGNVSVQGTVYSRKDSLLSALFDACDAEFPGIGNFYMSKDGVATFHGRFARFFPDRPGYNINHWYVGNEQEAALDPTIVPHTNPLTFHRSKDDIINASYALPQGVDETDGGVVHASDTDSQDAYGYRSDNFDGLIVSAGHGLPGDDNAPTTAVQEANKFAAYYVGNYSTPQDRVGTLRFVSRSLDAIGATALWDLLTRVELGDVITLTSAHAGGGGFDADFFVEQIRYTVSPGQSDDIPNLVLELEVSPATFFSYNPFGSHDSGDS